MERPSRTFRVHYLRDQKASALPQPADLRSRARSYDAKCSRKAGRTRSAPCPEPSPSRVFDGADVLCHGCAVGRLEAHCRANPAAARSGVTAERQSQEPPRTPRQAQFPLAADGHHTALRMCGCQPTHRPSRKPGGCDPSAQLARASPLSSLSRRAQPASIPCNLMRF